MFVALPVFTVMVGIVGVVPANVSVLPLLDMIEYPSALKVWLCTVMGVSSSTVPTPVGPKIASSPSVHVLGETQFVLVEFQAKLPAPLFHVFVAARTCGDVNPISVRLTAMKEIDRFMLGGCALVSVA